MRKIIADRILETRTAANKAGDYMQVIICELALGNDVDLTEYDSLTASEVTRLESMSRETAITECARVYVDTARVAS